MRRSSRAASPGIVPVTRLEDRPIGTGVPGPVTRRLRAAREALDRRGVTASGCRRAPRRGHVTRVELIARTRRLVEEGERIQGQPSLDSLRTWLQISDELLSAAWGSMDRYHLAWLMVGKPKQVIRGRPMTDVEEAAYVREVAEQKTAALRMSLDAVERQGIQLPGTHGKCVPL